jgi:K+-transporting ATPase ATPase A chain
MTVNGWFQILLFLGVVLALTAPLGRFMTRVFNSRAHLAGSGPSPIERLIYR